MVDRRALGLRMADARFYAQRWRQRNLSLRQLGQLVAEQFDDGRGYSGTQVKRWLDGGVIELDLEYVLAYARVCGVNPGWLAFGDECRNGATPEREEPPGVPVETILQTRRQKRRGGRAG